ncbi:magnesium transporter [Patescibacteria group bacterium]|nr:magnesium transporter [Patescibacteria group bacterium]
MKQKILYNNKHYPKDSAARVLTARVPIVNQDLTINEIKEILFEHISEFETINYIYVVNKNNKIKGVISIKDIFRRAKNEIVRKIMIKDIITASNYTTQEKIAFLAIEHNLKAIPIIDKNGCLLGVVSSDNILNIIHTEATNDILHLAGIHGSSDSSRYIITASAMVHFQKRLPWLTLGLLGGVVAALVVGFFEQSLQNHLILAAFIPAVAYMADAVGTQTQTIFIRSIALDCKLNLRKYVLREMKVGFTLAIILGFLILIISLIFWKSVVVSFILGLSIFITIIVAMLIGVSLPWFFMKLKYDPAIASGPLATVFRDILSLILYLSIAQFILSLI